MDALNSSSSRTSIRRMMPARPRSGHDGSRSPPTRERSRVDRDVPPGAAVGVGGSEACVVGAGGARDVAAFLERLTADGALTRATRPADLGRNGAAWAGVRWRTTRRARRGSRLGGPGVVEGAPRILRGLGRDDAVAAFADQLAREVRGRSRLVLVGRACERDELLDPFDAARHDPLLIPRRSRSGTWAAVGRERDVRRH